MHSNIASAAAKPAALPASADSQAKAEDVFKDLKHLFENHADFAAAVRECKSSRNKPKQPQSGEGGVGILTAGCDERRSKRKQRQSKRKQRQSGEAEPSHAPGDVQGHGVGICTARCNDELRSALEKPSTDDELPNVEVQVTGCRLVDNQDHWSKSILMSKRNKHLFSKMLNCTDVELPKAIHFPVEGLESYLRRAGFDLESFCQPVKMELPPKASPGQWWRFVIKSVGGMDAWEKSHGTPEWTDAWHGTSTGAASRILKSGFEPAHNLTENVSGVYLEGVDRKENVMNYATHSHDHPLPQNFLAAVVLEVKIDERITRRVRGQWVQPDPHSVVVVAALVHLIDVQTVYREGFIGWIRVARRSVVSLSQAATTRCPAAVCVL